MSDAGKFVLAPALFVVAVFGLRALGLSDGEAIAAGAVIGLAVAVGLFRWG